MRNFIKIKSRRKTFFCIQIDFFYNLQTLYFDIQNTIWKIHEDLHSLAFHVLSFLKHRSVLHSMFNSASWWIRQTLWHIVIQFPYRLKFFFLNLHFFWLLATCYTILIIFFELYRSNSWVHYISMSCTLVGRIWCGIHATTKVHKLLLDNQLKDNMNELSHSLAMDTYMYNLWPKSITRIRDFAFSKNPVYKNWYRYTIHESKRIDKANNSRGIHR